MQLTEHMIIARAKHSDYSSIKRINLWGCGLSDISVIRKLTNVEVLALSVNNLNCLKPLEACKKLQELYLRKNNIQDFNELLHLRDLPLLSHLWLGENPCCEAAGANYRARVVKMLPNLQKLDDALITAEDIELAKKLDTIQAESSRLAQPFPIGTESPQGCASSWTHKANKHFENSQLMQNQFPPRPEGPESPRVQQNRRWSREFSPLPCLLEEPIGRGKPPSPQHLISCNNFPTFEPIEERSVPRVPPPALQTSHSDIQNAHWQESTMIRRTNSLNQTGQFPQLNLVLQIEQPQSQQNQIREASKLNSHRSSLQSINERFEAEANQLNRHYQNNFMGSLSNHYDRRSYSRSCSYSRDSLEAYDREAIRRSMSFACPSSKRSNQWQHNMDLANNNETRRPDFDRNFGREDGSYTTRIRARSSATLTTAPVSCEKRRSNLNLLSGILCIVQELDYDSLHGLQRILRCRIDELSQE